MIVRLCTLGLLAFVAAPHRFSSFQDPVEEPEIQEPEPADGTEGRTPWPPKETNSLAEILSCRVVVGGCPSVACDRLLAERLRDASDIKTAWSMTQGLRLRDHVHDGWIWSHDEVAERILSELVNSNADPAKRALAADALGDFASLRTMFLDDALDPAIRAFAASVLPPPRGESEAVASELLAAWWQLLAHTDEYVRAMAAPSIAAWFYLDADAERFLELARKDPSPRVRAACFATLPSLGLPTARRTLLEIVNDPKQSEEIRQLATQARDQLVIR